jgi:hypothetical protein
MASIRTLLPAVVTVAALGVAACGGARYTTVTVPPVLDLAGWDRAALATFSVENAKGTLHELATRRFSERLLHATRGLEILEIDPFDPVLHQAGERTFGPATARAVGETHPVPVVFSGHLKVSNVKPRGGLATLAIPFVDATVTVDLTVGLHATATGGTLWRASGSLSEQVGHLAIVNGEPSFSASDPNAAYGRLVERLVAIVTRDLYPTYERRRI